MKIKVRMGAEQSSVMPQDANNPARTKEAEGSNQWLPPKREDEPAAPPNYQERGYFGSCAVARHWPGSIDFINGPLIPVSPPRKG